MCDDVVEHLAAVDVLEEHVVVVLMDDHLAHAADVRMVQQHRQRRLAQRADLLRGILGRLLGRRLVGGGRPGVCPRQDLDCELATTVSDCTSHKRNVTTFSAVTLCVASFTLPMLPAPSVLLSM